MAWAIRTVVSGAALLWGTGLDLLAISAYSLAAASWGGGFYLGRMPKKPDEDLTKEIFPDS